MIKTSTPALLGGNPVRDVNSKPWPSWPIWGKEEEKVLLDVLHSGVWSYNGKWEKQFNAAFASYVGTKHCISAVNGTVTLQLALEALGIGWGDEVILPGLTWQATAATVIDVNAVPILVDVCEDTWCLDPAKVREAITPRTRAIIPVHLYGCFTDMDELMSIARENNLFVIEDCAHKHGGTWRGQKAGSIGDIGSFSFQLSKHLTAGEGGALTTNDEDLASKLDALRNCGRRPETAAGSSDKGAGYYEDDGNFIQSGNYRITEFQAALLTCGLKRMPDQNNLRDKNASYLNEKLEGIDGVLPMRRDDREEPAFFNFSFRYDRKKFRNLPVEKFREAISTELGLQVDTCYEPLNNASLYCPHTKPSRHRITDKYWDQINPKRFSLPVCEKVYEQQAICMHHSALLGITEDMDDIINAILKIRESAEEL